MFKCKVCGTELPDGTEACTNCLVCQEPPAKYMPGVLVRCVLADKGIVVYNYVVDSYYNHDIEMRMYRLNELMAMPVYREDWLEPVSLVEIERVNKTGLLEVRKNGGFEHPLMEGVNM